MCNELTTFFAKSLIDLVKVCLYWPHEGSTSQTFDLIRVRLEVSL